MTGYVGAVVQVMSEEFTNPSGVAVDSLTGDLYLADESGNCVAMLSKETGVTTTIAGNTNCRGEVEWELWHH